MLYRLLADAVVLVHFGFVAFVVLGGLLVARRPRLWPLHVAAAAWAAVIEFTGWICPLTPLENTLQVWGGGATYGGDFVARYLLAVLYPDGLTRRAQVVLGAIVIGWNLAIYLWVFTFRRREPRAG